MKNIHLKKMVFIVALSVCLSQNLVAMDPEEKEIEDEVAETLMKIGIVKELANAKTRAAEAAEKADECARTVGEYARVAGEK